MYFMKYKEIEIGATYSTLDPIKITRFILSGYNIPTPTGCDFWVRGFNDTYKVTTKTGNYSLRVYRQGWRSLSDIEYELDALVYLKAVGCDVAYPIEKRGGGFITAIRSPEGIRYAILTNWVEGSPLNYDVEGSAARFAKSVAQAHAL